MSEAFALRQRLDRAIERDRPRDALDALDRLEHLEPDRPRWPHRRGDMHRRLAERKEAIMAYERAVRLYAAQGFITHAAALAKLVMDLDPKRSDVMSAVDPAVARQLKRRQKTPAPPTPIDFTASEPKLKASGAPGNEVQGSEGKPAFEIDIDFEVEAPSGAREVEGPSADDLARLPAFPLFAEAPKDALIALVRGADLVEAEHGASIIRRGAPANELFAIVEGGVVVHVPGVGPEAWPRLSEGDIFGESCLLEHEPRKADVLVDGRLFALRIPRTVLRDVVGRFPEIGDQLFRLLSRRLLSNLLQGSPLFSALDMRARRELARHFEVRRLPAGFTLFVRGQPVDAVHLLVLGRVEVSDGIGQRSAGPGTILGQQAMFARRPSVETAVAQSELIVLSLSGPAFARVVAEYPTVLEQLVEESGDLSVDVELDFERPSLLA